MQRHGYKGAFELAATVDYLFGFDATAGVVHDWMYETLAKEYVLDETNQEFMRKSNPWALRGIVEKLHEAADRGLWEEPDPDVMAAMQQVYLELEGDLEDRDAGGSASSASAWGRSTSRPRRPTRCGRWTTWSPPTRRAVGRRPAARRCDASICAAHGVELVAGRRPGARPATTRGDYPRRRRATGTRRAWRRTRTVLASRRATPASWCGATRRSTTRRSGSSQQLAERTGARRTTCCPGISAPQLLAARHRIVLHEVGAAGARHHRPPAARGDRRRARTTSW